MEVTDNNDHQTETVSGLDDCRINENRNDMTTESEHNSNAYPVDGKLEEDRNLAQLGSKLCHINNCKIIKNIYHDLQESIDYEKTSVRNGIRTYSRKQKKTREKFAKTKINQHPRKTKQNKITKKVKEREINKSEAPDQQTVKSKDSKEIDRGFATTDVSSETDESDGLQEFLDALEPKKRKRRPKQKRELTQEEIEAKEKESLRKRTCEVCGMVFSIPKGLQNHMRVKHTFEKPYTCEICNEKFAVQSTYALHRRRHLGIKPHLCNICGKTFLRNTDLRIHMRTHNKVRDIKCNLCSNAYNSGMSLKKHMLIKHTDPSEWKHECQICGKKCVSTTTLNLHVKQHNQDRSFKCHLCDKGFYTNQNLQVHVRTHSASTKFNCELCPNGYRSNEALQRHLLRMHGIGEEKVPSVPKFFCPICNDGFLQKARLEKHLRLHETGEEEYPFKCESCLKQYKDRNFFTMHMRNKHNLIISDNYFKVRFSNGSDPYPSLTYADSISDEMNESS